MMTISHLLEDFSVLPIEDTAAAQLMSEDSLEDLRLASFEQGYTAGWEDAIRAQATDQTRVTGTLGRNLEDLSFTYQEALVQLTNTVEPVFQALVSAVLPEALMQSVGMQIVEQCTELAREQLDQPVLLVVPVGNANAIKPVLQKNLAMKVEVVESADMADGQVSLRIGDSEREIDHNLLLSTLRTSIEAFFFNVDEAKQYG